MLLDNKSLLEEVKYKIVQKIKKTYAGELKVSLKKDASPVTEIDHYISDLIKESFEIESLGIDFMCEEGSGKKSLACPCVVLDPIDGTKGLISKTGECAVSLAFLNSKKINDPKNEGWIFNPFTDFELLSSSVKKTPWFKAITTKTIFGLVSRSEWESGLYTNEIKEKIVVPKGSIALKLGLLASGASDFVWSKHPKNLWDIAAGTVMAESLGISFYYNGIKQTEFKSDYPEGNLLWCSDTLISRFKNNMYEEV